MDTEKILQDITNVIEAPLTETEDNTAVDTLAQNIESENEMSEILPSLKSMFDNYKKNVETCDQKVKDFQASKKLWKARQERISRLLLSCLNRLGLKEVKNGKLKCSMSSRTALEVDEDALLAPYVEMAKVWGASVEPFVKVSVSLDKKALNDYTKANPQILIDRPEVIHSKQIFSATVKPHTTKVACFPSQS